MGVDGFRIDALPFIIEDSSYKDEPLIQPNTVDDNHTYFLLDHIYSRDQPGTYKIVEEFRAVLDEYTLRDGNTRYWHENQKNTNSYNFVTVFKTYLTYKK